jgi:small redox-active disulfide protein 2
MKYDGGIRMKIEVLGDGCARCNRLYENVLKAVKLSGKEVEVVKEMDPQKISDHKVISLPALLIDGIVKSAGKFPEAEQIKAWIE